MSAWPTAQPEASRRTGTVVGVARPTPRLPTWPGYVALWVTLGATLANEVIRHGSEYVVLPPRPLFPLAPASLWLSAIVAVVCGGWAVSTGRVPGLSAVLASGVSALGLTAAASAALTPDHTGPAPTMDSDSAMWLLLALSAASAVLAVSVLPGDVALRQLFIAGLILAWLSVVAILVRLVVVPDPSMVQMRRETTIYPAQGIHWNVNLLGMAMGAVLVIQVAYLRMIWRRLDGRRAALLVGLGPVTAALLMVASSSRAAIAAAAVALAVSVLPLQRWRTSWVSLALVAGCALATIAPLAATGMGLVNLNGRRYLWSLVVDEIATQPLLGRAFGNIHNEQHAHSQVLETWLQSGVAGVVVLIALTVVLAVAAVGAARFDHKLGVAVFTYAALLGSSETLTPWTIALALPPTCLFIVFGLCASASTARDRLGSALVVRPAAGTGYDAPGEGILRAAGRGVLITNVVLLGVTLVALGAATAR